jgi:hypothetical protein
MKNLFVLVFFAVTLVSCSSVEQHRTAIEEVSTMWTEMTPKVEEMVQNCTELNTAWGAMADMVTPVSTDMDEVVVNEVEALNMEYKDNAKSVSEMMEEMTSYVASMKEKGAVVQTMVDGLAAGKIEGDVLAMTADAKTMMEEATMKMEEWTVKMGEYSAAATQMAAKMMPVEEEATEASEM